MATEEIEAYDSPPETEFGQVSRLKGVLFKYLTFGASVFGIAALAALLAYVFWDAFGMKHAEAAWYLVFGVTTGLPTLGFVVYAERRDRNAGQVALEIVSTLLGTLMVAFAAVIVLAVIAGSGTWFAYFVTTLGPLGGLILYGRRNPEKRWIGLGLLGVAIIGPIVGTLLHDRLATVGSLVGGPGVFFLSVFVPAVAVLREYVARRYTTRTANAIAAGTVVAAIGAVPIIDSLAAVSRSVWLLFLPTFVVPSLLAVGISAYEPDRRIGLAGPVLFVVGVGLSFAISHAVGIAGPQPWLDWQYVTSSPSTTAEKVGLYPAIIGSIFVIVIVAVMTFFVGIGAAIYLEEYAPQQGLGGKISRIIRVNISNLAGVPSVVYGLLGLAVFANGLNLGFGAVITAAFTLSLLILPIVIIAAQEAIRSVPDSLRKASYGMGATRWQTARNVVIPEALPGVFTGTILALGRAIGETAPLIMIGAATTTFSAPEGLFDSTSAMPLQIFNWSGYPSQAFQHGVVAAGIVTLLIVLLSMNSVAIILRNRFERDL